MPAPRRLAPALIAAVVGVSVLTGCGGEEEPGPAAAATSVASTSANSSEGDGAGEPAGETGGSDVAPPFEANTDPDTAGPSADALLSVTDIRVGRHDGFDRVVLETSGTGTPGWDIRYVPQAASQGSGDAIAVGGDAVLQVTLTGVGYPYDTGVDEFPIGNRVAAPDTATVTEVVFDGTFEGQSVAFVGTTAQTPFRVYLLESPARVVVEVADRG